jgi:hypothetical protein
VPSTIARPTTPAALIFAITPPATHTPAAVDRSAKMTAEKGFTFNHVDDSEIRYEPVVWHWLKMVGSAQPTSNHPSGQRS